MDINADKAMMVMMVTVAPVVAMMPAVRFYYDSFPVFFGLVARRGDRRVVLCQ